MVNGLQQSPCCRCFWEEVVPSALADQEPGFAGNSKRIGSMGLLYLPT